MVRRQVEAGVNVVNDGEASKLRSSTYVTARLTGFGGASSPPPPSPYAEAFPDYVARLPGDHDTARPACVGPLAARDLTAVHTDLANLTSALTSVEVADAFLSAASPGVIALFLENQYDPSHEAYLFALAEAMKPEYDAIHQAGVVLQLDCPDLAAPRHRAGESLAEFRRQVALHIEALNHATRDIPGEAMRLHLCWGNDEGPHTLDVPLADIIDLVLAARPAALSFEAANPRHAHVWTLFEHITLPAGKILIPGVVDSTTNYVEHPELVAQRLIQYARLVGREQVIAGTDCGLASLATAPTVHPTVAWAKLRAMVEGAQRASAQLWARAAD